MSGAVPLWKAGAFVFTFTPEPADDPKCSKFGISLQNGWGDSPVVFLAGAENLRAIITLDL